MICFIQCIPFISVYIPLIQYFNDFVIISKYLLNFMTNSCEIYFYIE